MEENRYIKQLEEMYGDLEASPVADTMDFMVRRTNPKPGETFSKEAMDELVDAFRVFLGARIAHHWNQKPDGVKDVGPSVLRLTAALTIDDVHVEPDEWSERPWYMVDGQKRVVN